MAGHLCILGLSLYGPQAASHRVRLAQFQPGLAAAGIELQIQSLLGDAYLQRRCERGWATPAASGSSTAIRCAVPCRCWRA